VTRAWRSTESWRERRGELNGKRIGFVPTMGALHRGHESLVERCRRENDVVVVSIFVNPTQFNDPKDLERYPRTLEADLALLEKAGADEVLVPHRAEMYPHGYRFRIDVEDSVQVMEGLHRPGYFQGMTTVVMKLLNMVRADRAYFGEKDFQQLRVVTDMVQEFFIPTEIVPCETVRDESGLAESSRNQLLSPEARANAAVLYRALTGAASTGEAKAQIEAAGLRVEYLEQHWGRRFVAAYADSVRLIDNVPLASE